MTISRVVLEASVEGALLLLFIDDDQLSYLELAANDASSLHEFPEPGSISST